MNLKDAWNLVDSKTDLAFDSGTLDLLARFGCDKGHLTGAIQPVLKDAGVTADHRRPGHQDQGLGGQPGGQRSSPIGSRAGTPSPPWCPSRAPSNDPKLQLWPTIFGVIRNAFVQGIAESFAHLPPPKAKEPEGILEQAKSATDVKAGLPKATAEEGLTMRRRLALRPGRSALRHRMRPHRRPPAAPRPATAPRARCRRPPAKRAVTPKTEEGHPPLAASPDELMKPGSRARRSARRCTTRATWTTPAPPGPLPRGGEGVPEESGSGRDRLSPTTRPDAAGHQSDRRRPVARADRRGGGEAERNGSGEVRGNRPRPVRRRGMSPASRGSARTGRSLRSCLPR